MTVSPRVMQSPSSKPSRPGSSPSARRSAGIWPSPRARHAATATRSTMGRMCVTQVEPPGGVHVLAGRRRRHEEIVVRIRQDVPRRARLTLIVPLVRLGGTREPLPHGARRNHQRIETSWRTSGLAARDRREAILLFRKVGRERIPGQGEPVVVIVDVLRVLHPTAASAFCRRHSTRHAVGATAPGASAGLRFEHRGQQRTAVLRPRLARRPPRSAPIRRSLRVE